MRLFERSFPTAAAATFAMTNPPVRSPFATATLSRVVLADMTGVKAGTITRSDAMKVPAIARARGLICGTLSRYPLSRWNGDTRLEPAPWMVSTRTGISPRLRMLWTLDDQLFSGVSVWAVERGPKGDGADVGPMTDAIRIAPGVWTLDEAGRVLVDGKPVSDEEVLVFEGPQEGLLTIADEAIDASRAMRSAWATRVKSPIPLVVLKQTDKNVHYEDTEVDEMLDDAEAARANGGAMFAPDGIDPAFPGDVKTDLFIEGRNAERLDYGNYANMPAAMLDGSMSTATLTYSTTEGRRSEFVDFSLAYWAMPIEARASQADVLPAPDEDARFDLEYLTTPTQPATNPGQKD